jgi:hypothetical protein
VYVLLIPPIAVALTLLVIALRRLAIRPRRRVDAMEAQRRYLEALDPRSPSRKAAQQALQDAPKQTKRLHRHA